MSDWSFPSFSGLTWVAFSDLCGLKAMYRKSPDRAAEALDHFYQLVYDTHEPNGITNALAVSDCAVFWLSPPTTCGSESIAPDELEYLLARLQLFHRQMARLGLLVRSTLAFGPFCYERRIELPRLRKNMIVGGAYMAAFAANEKVREGAAVILKTKHIDEPPRSLILPAVSPRNLANRNVPAGARTKTETRKHSGRFSRFLVDCKEPAGWEFVWWLDDPAKVTDEMKRVEKAVESRHKSLMHVYRGETRGESRR